MGEYWKGTESELFACEACGGLTPVSQRWEWTDAPKMMVCPECFKKKQKLAATETGARSLCETKHVAAALGKVCGRPLLSGGLFTAQEMTTVLIVFDHGEFLLFIPKELDAENPELAEQVRHILTDGGTLRLPLGVSLIRV